MRRAQTATEYLIILAVVIVIALIVVGVIGGIPSIGSGTSDRGNKAKELTNNIGIASYAVYDCGTKVTLRNNNPAMTTIRDISINNTECNSTELPILLKVGESKIIDCQGICSALGSRYSYPLQIGWKSDDNALFVQNSTLSGVVGIGNNTPDLEVEENETINGTCGTADETNTSEAPTTSLCSAGTASSVSGTGPWYWNCTGSNGGTNDSCSANLAEEPLACLEDEFCGGDGSEGDPYQIATCQQLQNINLDLEAYYELIRDIDCSDSSTWNDDAGFDPIGEGWTGLSGAINGNNYKIEDLYINRPDTDYVGLFSVADRINNLGLENANIIGRNYVGGISGASYPRYENVWSSGTIAGNDNVGGLTGYGEEAVEIYTSYSTTIISGSNNVGGLIGRTDNGDIISESYFSGEITSTGNNVGGLIGKGDTPIENSYSTGNIVGNDNIGGLIGYFMYRAVTGSYTTGTIAGNDYVGGLIGFSEASTVSDSHSSGAISGNDFIGGLIGAQVPYDSDGQKSYCTRSYSDGSVSGNMLVGGLIGNVYGEITESYSIAEVSGNSAVGGLGGGFYADLFDYFSEPAVTVVNSYYIGNTITGGNSVAGLIGFFQSDSPVIENSYASTEITEADMVYALVFGESGEVTPINSYYNSDKFDQPNQNGDPLTTSQMTTVPRPEESYVDWDFSGTWVQNDGEYPTLAWQ